MSADYELTMQDGVVYMSDPNSRQPKPKPINEMYIDDQGNPCGGNSIAEFLSDRRIIDIRKLGTGKFSLTEGCDGYFRVDVDRKIFQQWINELQEMLNEGD